MAEATAIAQRYWGPDGSWSTDARCYRATDILVAGFTHHGIGPVLGIARNTGAGGSRPAIHLGGEVVGPRSEEQGARGLEEVLAGQDVTIGQGMMMIG